MIIVTIYLLAVPIESSSEVTQLNVGQGDACFIQSKNKRFLVDAGNKRFNFQYGLQRLINNKGLNTIFITHADMDHFGGLLTLKNFPPVKRLSVSQRSGSKSYEQLLNEVKLRDVSIEVPGIEIVHSDPFMRIYCLDNGRFGRKLGFDKNNSSLILLVMTQKWSYLIMGDAEISQEEFLLGWSPLLKGAIIKVGHHGSAGGTSDRFLSQISPMQAIISCGENNHFGHPDPRVLDRLSYHNSGYFRTDYDGFWQTGPLKFPIW